MHFAADGPERTKADLHTTLHRHIGRVHEDVAQEGTVPNVVPPKSVLCLFFYFSLKSNNVVGKVHPTLAPQPT